MHMIRRRRPVRGIDFSFDSFLDVVANVVGIILRLILVAWVGASSYQSKLATPTLPTLGPDEAVATLPEPTDPLTTELPRKQTELEKANARLQEQLLSAAEVDRQT